MRKTQARTKPRKTAKRLARRHRGGRRPGECEGHGTPFLAPPLSDRVGANTDTLPGAPRRPDVLRRLIEAGRGRHPIDAATAPRARRPRASRAEPGEGGITTSCGVRAWRYPIDMMC